MELLLCVSSSFFFFFFFFLLHSFSFSVVFVLGLAVWRFSRPHIAFRNLGTRVLRIFKLTDRPRGDLPFATPPPFRFTQLVISLGVTYAAVPLYRAFCAATGFSGTPMTDPTRYIPERMYADEVANARKRITVHFEATASDELKWKFTPQQRFVKVLPGETALAFYTAENMGKEDVIGIATYNTTPAKVSRVFFVFVFLLFSFSLTPKLSSVQPGNHSRFPPANRQRLRTKS